MLLFPSLGGMGDLPCIAFEAVIDFTIFYRAIAGLGIAVFRKISHGEAMRLKITLRPRGGWPFGQKIETKIWREFEPNLDHLAGNAQVNSVQVR